MPGQLRRVSKPAAGGGAIVLIIVSFIEWVTGSGLLDLIF
jgi:hypothetical protein